MPNTEQVKKIKCPYCGWIRSVPVAVIEDASTTSVVRVISEPIKAISEKIKTALADALLDEANVWMDMPKCPHCENVYKYNVRTGETRA